MFNLNPWTNVLRQSNTVKFQSDSPISSPIVILLASRLTPVQEVLFRVCRASFYISHPCLFGVQNGTLHKMYPDSKVYEANMGPPGSCRPQMGPCWPHELCYLGNTAMGEIRGQRTLTRIYLFRRLLTARSEIALANFECHWPVWEVLKNNQ